MKYRYCPLCGRELTKIFSYDEGYVPYCQQDDKLYFDLPKPTVVVAVIKDEDILLLSQSYIYKNSKVLVSGYVSPGETVEDTAYREVKEETDIEIKDIRYLGSYALKDRDLLMLTYVGYYKSGQLTKSPEVGDLQWIKLQEALSHMEEDEVGKWVVRKILKEENYKSSPK